MICIRDLFTKKRVLENNYASAAYDWWWIEGGSKQLWPIKWLFIIFPQNFHSIQCSHEFERPIRCDKGELVKSTQKVDQGSIAGRANSRWSSMIVRFLNIIGKKRYIFFESFFNFICYSLFKPFIYWLWEVCRAIRSW